MNLPKESQERLEQICQGFHRTPFLGSQDVARHLRTLRYGANENIILEAWSRFPHEIHRFATCNDIGILAYFMCRHLGLDCILVEFPEFRDTEQSHLSVLVRGSRKNYLVDAYVEEFDCIAFNPIFEEQIFDECYSRRGAHGAADFFRTGQSLAHSHGCAYLDEAFYTRDHPLFYTLMPSLLLHQNSLRITSTYELPGFYMHVDCYPNKEIEVSVSNEIDNIARLGDVKRLSLAIPTPGYAYSYPDYTSLFFPIVKDEERTNWLKRYMRATYCSLIASLETTNPVDGFNLASRLSLKCPEVKQDIEKDIEELSCEKPYLPYTFMSLLQSLSEQDRFLPLYHHTYRLTQKAKRLVEQAA